MESSLTSLIALAAFTGFVHTLLGPDHYVPFIAMAKAGGWSLARTVLIASVCCIGHVAGSVILGFLGVGLGWALAGMEAFESARGSLAAWLLIGFGLAYTIWGLRRAWINQPHGHVHIHADGRVHRHHHGEDRNHVHNDQEPATHAAITGWALFTIFIFGPCEPLIPQLMIPAAAKSWAGVAMVALVFGLATWATMISAVTVGYLGLARISASPIIRYTHALTGMALTICGLAMVLGL
ncbi:MAG: hypothetical protein ACPGXK_07945 [Phycisphaerae bacterium]